MTDHALVLRGITTVYNVDYVTDVTFHLNGALEARALPAPSRSNEVKCFVFDFHSLAVQVSVSLSGVRPGVGVERGIGQLLLPALL